MKMMESPAQWSDLPSDLLLSISDRLDSHTDILYLRSVCSTWRSSFPALVSRFPHDHHLPFWSSSSSSHRHDAVSGFLVLKESAIYRLEGVHNQKASWLVKLQETWPGKMRVLDLFSNDRICVLPDNFPHELNLQDFRTTLIRRAYRIEYRNRCEYQYSGNTVSCCHGSCFWSLNADKAVVVMSSAEEFAVMAVHSAGKLGFLRSGDEKWTVLDDTWNVLYEDIIGYGGGFWVVDDKGKAVMFDVCFRALEVAMALPGGGGHKKHLVECSGQVVLVDKYVKHVWESEYSKAAVEFRVFKLNREEKTWEEVRELGDVALFIGDDCSFSLDAGEVPWILPNRIFYRDYRNGGRLRALSSDASGVFKVDDATNPPSGLCGDLVFPCF